MARLERVAFLNGGYCRQFKWLADGRGWGTRAFQAVFAVVEHPDRGLILIDTGYGGGFREATRAFPQRIYGWLTPVTPHPLGTCEAVLREAGFAEPVGDVIVTHLHPDHVGGLRDFPEARFTYAAEAWEAVRGLPVAGQVRHGFLADLMPEDFAARGRALRGEDFKPGNGDLAEFEVHDWAGDGSILLVRLPGHATGHFGVILDCAPRPVFYVVDACWNIDFVRHPRDLPWISRRFQVDYEAYQRTLERLGALSREKYRFLACHCPETQDHVANRTD